MVLCGLEGCTFEVHVSTVRTFENFCTYICTVENAKLADTDTSYAPMVLVGTKRRIKRPILQETNSITVQKCETECQLHPVCIAFSFSASLGNCSLHQNSYFDLLSVPNGVIEHVDGWKVFDRHSGR